MKALVNIYNKVKSSCTFVPSSTVYPQSSLPPVSEPRCRWCGEWRHPRPRGRGGQGAQHPAAARRVRAAVGAADGALLARVRPHHLGQRGVRHRPPRVRAADHPSDSSHLHIQTNKETVVSSNFHSRRIICSVHCVNKLVICGHECNSSDCNCPHYCLLFTLVHTTLIGQPDTDASSLTP